MLKGALVLVGTAMGGLLLWALGVVLLLRWRELGPVVARLGVGPRLLARELLGVRWQLGLVPMGASVWTTEADGETVLPLPGVFMWAPHGLVVVVAGGLGASWGPVEQQAALSYVEQLVWGRPPGLWTALGTATAHAAEAPLACSLALLTLMGLVNTGLGMIQHLGQWRGRAWLSLVPSVVFLGLLCRGCWLELGPG